jgi:hypothetical protein
MKKVKKNLPKFCYKCNEKLNLVSHSKQGTFDSQTGKFIPEYYYMGRKVPSTERIVRGLIFNKQNGFNGTPSGYHEVFFPWDGKDVEDHKINCPNQDIYGEAAFEL